VFEKINRIYFVGIGGSGMSGIAEMLLNLGYQVSGSDMKESAAVRRLRKMGADIKIGHSRKNIKEPHVVVVSSAIKEDNSEVAESHEKKIPVIPRAEMLAELMRIKYSICVAGTHGKTTTTSLIGMMLLESGLDPTVVVGGLIKNLKSSVKLGKGEFIAAEADESDGSFLHYSPTIGVVTSIDNDHMDYYKDMNSVREIYTRFLNKVPFYGFSVLFGDDENVRKIIPALRRPYKTYGLKSSNDYYAVDCELAAGKSVYTACSKGSKLGVVEIKSSGMHNILNSLAAIAVGMEMGLDFEKLKGGIACYEGVGRRLEKAGEKGGILFYDDYAHHPSEIKLSLSSLNDIYPERRIIAVFQPHRYSRTRDLFTEFPEAFSSADMVYITSIYGAGEPPIEGVTSELIVREFEDEKRVKYFPSRRDLLEELENNLTPGDICITLGAGDINSIPFEILKR